MPAHILEADEPFFREWNAHHGHMSRSRTRAKLLADLAGIDRSPAIPTIGVVGSKGKGSAVAAATQYLNALGYRVGTISSPPFLDNRERIRLDGAPLTHDQYSLLAAELSQALDGLPPVEETNGYIAPTGAFTLFGAHFLMKMGATALVIEEGLGGATDEISQFRLDTLIVTQVFLEHEGVIGNSVEEIALNLVGAGDERTRHVVVPNTQSDAALQAIATLLPEAQVHSVGPVPDFGFGPLTSLNVATGYEAARITHEAGVGTKTLAAAPDYSKLAAHLNLPGRSTRANFEGTSWFLDAAISAEGVASALASISDEAVFANAPIIVCMPDIKDVRSILNILDRDRTILVRTHEDHLSFSAYPPDWRAVSLSQALSELEGAEAVIALGTMSFAAEMAAYLHLDTSVWWRPIEGAAE